MALKAPISIELQGMAELLARFKGVEEGMLDFRQLGAWKGVQSVFYKIMAEQFATAGGAGKSGQWAALSPAYAAVKLKKYNGPTQILRATGTLYKSLTSQGATGSVYNESAQSLEIGTSLEYAAYHQTGTRAPKTRAGAKKGIIGPVLNKMGPQRGGMPARPLVDFTDEQESQLMKPIQDKLVQLIGNAKLRNLRGF